MPSQVLDNLIKILSFEMPSLSYILMKLIALSICACLSNDSLKTQTQLLSLLSRFNPPTWHLLQC